MQKVSRRGFLSAAGSVACVAALALASGCSGDNNGAQNNAQTTGSNQTASSDGSGSAFHTFTVGTLATEDILPLWVAESEDLFSQHNLSVKIVPFQSATELIAGVSSGEVDLAMTDIMVTAGMFAGGVGVQMVWVTLGTTPAQGRFGIMVGPNSGVASLQDLAGVPIGVGSNTILEYVMDKLMEAAGIPQDQVKVEEIQKLPVRYQAMVQGEVEAAALPATLLALGEANGCKLIADDTRGENLSQSVMIARTKVMDDPALAEGVTKLKEVWDAAAKLINEDAEKYREVLISHANLPEDIAKTYPISEYPYVQLPTSNMVDPVLAWMDQKGYLSRQLSYDQASGTFSAK